MYVDSMKALVPWFFSMDHHNYARWIPVHIRDMENLPPTIKEEFEQHGHWVVFKTTNRFSAIPIDQAHENNNDIVKGSGGAVGLTENPSAFRKWMLAGPEQARMLKEFEASLSEGSEMHYHHEEGLSTQQSFRGQVLSLAKTISDMGNPFMNDTAELLMLDTCDVMNESVTNTVRTVEKLGKSQYDEYHQSVLVDCTRSIHDPIKKNSLPLFKCPTPKEKSKQAGKIATLKADVSLFSQLYIVAQDREIDVGTFFQHENNPYPPSLSDRGKLRLGKKSDLLKCLIQAPDTDTPGSLETQDLDDDTDLAACFQHVAEADSSVGELDVVELAGLLSSIEQTPASEQLTPRVFSTKRLWMALPFYTSSRLLESQRLKIMPMMFSYHTSDTNWKVLTEWMWCGTHITAAVLKRVHEKREAKESGEKLLVQTRSLESGKSFSRTQTTNKNSLPSCQRKLPQLSSPMEQ